MTDDDLRARLRRADPAASLPRLAPDRVERILGETMAIAHTVEPSRRRLKALAAAVLVLLAAGTAWLLLVVRPGEPDSPESIAPMWGTLPASGPANASGSPDVSGPAGEVTTLTVPGVRAKCREPEPALLAAGADLAFDGKVTDISGNVVTLRVAKVYRGAAVERVRVEQAGDASETMLGSGKFETGKDYLIAASGGSVLICGYSGEADSPGLRGLYERAF